jgi:hypothetical protein
MFRTSQVAALVRTMSEATCLPICCKIRLQPVLEDTIAVNPIPIDNVINGVCPLEWYSKQCRRHVYLHSVLTYRILSVAKHDVVMRDVLNPTSTIPTVCADAGGGGLQAAGGAWAAPR